MINIKTQAKRNAKLLTDVDNMRTRYFERNGDVGVSFPAGEIFAYEKNLYYILSRSKKREFDPKWNMKPDYTSFDLYGTVIYWQLILFLNKIYSIEEYVDLEEIIVPSVNLIYEISKDKIKNDLVTPLHEEIKDSGVYLYKRGILDDIELEQLEAQNNLRELTTKQNISKRNLELQEFEDIIILDTTQAVNKFVELTHDPINDSSLEVKVLGLPTIQKYGYDYMLIKFFSLAENPRISWKSDDCPFGDGMDFLSEGDEIRIKYITKI